MEAKESDDAVPKKTLAATYTTLNACGVDVAAIGKQDGHKFYVKSYKLATNANRNKGPANRVLITDEPHCWRDWWCEHRCPTTVTARRTRLKEGLDGAVVAMMFNGGRCEANGDSDDGAAVVQNGGGGENNAGENAEEENAQDGGGEKEGRDDGEEEKEHGAAEEEEPHHDVDETAAMEYGVGDMEPMQGESQGDAGEEQHQEQQPVGDEGAAIEKAGASANNDGGNAEEEKGHGDATESGGIHSSNQGIADGRAPREEEDAGDKFVRRSEFEEIERRIRRLEDERESDRAQREDQIKLLRANLQEYRQRLGSRPPSPFNSRARPPSRQRSPVVASPKRPKQK